MAARELTLDELEDAKRLKRIWIAKRDELHLSQVKAAMELGYNSQGAVSQFINGKVALNFQAAAKFAKLLRVNVAEISPRFGRLVEKPTPSSLEGYTAPTTGVIGGMPTTAALNWFAFSREFCEALGVPAQNLKIVRLEDDSFKEFPIGTVFLVDDSYQTTAEDGVYLLQQGDKIIARRVLIGEEITLSSGHGKKQKVSRDTFDLLRVLGRVISVFATVAE